MTCQRRLLYWLPIAALGALALAAKMAIALTTRGSNDVVYWEEFLATQQAAGGVGVYQQISWFNHPPFMLHLLRLMDWLAQVSGLPFAFWLRLPATLADAGSLALLARLTGLPSIRTHLERRRVTLALAALAPISLMVSGFHGNTDPAMVFFVLLAVCLLDVWRSPLLAGAAFGMALNIKVVPLIFAPAFFLALPGVGRRLGFCAAAAVVVFAGSVPYVLQDPSTIARNVLGYSSFYGYWGLARLLNSAAPDSWLNLAFESKGRVLALAAAGLAALALNWPRRAVPLFLQCGVVAYLFMALTPGFGIQYLAWLVPWVVSLGPAPAALFYATSGLFAFQVYTYWSGGFPWYFADARNFVPEWWPPPIVRTELVCWASVLVILALLVRRAVETRRTASAPAWGDVGRRTWSAAVERVRRPEVVTAVAVVALVCAGYLALSWYDFDLLDEGYFLTNAHRVQLGGVPYRDFDTPYTPAIFYLYAKIMAWVGPNMAALRTPAVLGRGAELLVLYLLGRRLMPPFFAALAPALILAIDRAPPLWSIHPGWFATPATLLAVAAVARYIDRGGSWLLVGAGVASGVGFAFKQNLAAYGLMAALWLLVVAERFLAPVRLWGGDPGRGAPTRPVPGRPVLRYPVPLRHLRPLRHSVQAAALLLFPLTAAMIVRPYLSPLVALLFVVPLAVLSGAGAALAPGEVTWPEAGASSDADSERAAAREVSFFVRPLLVLAGFAAVTLPWLAVLVQALGWHLGLLKGFVGNIDPSGYYYGMVPPQLLHLRLVMGLLLVPVAVALLGLVRFWGRWGAGAAFGSLVALTAAGMTYPPDKGPNVFADARAALAWAGNAWGVYRATAPHPTDDLVLYLPVVAFWLAFGGLLWRTLAPRPPLPQGERGSTDSSPLPSLGEGLGVRALDLQRFWYVASGAALLLTQYPRMGYGHIVWSGGVLFTVGADLLHALYQALVGRVPGLRRSELGRVALCASLVLLPAAAAAPYVQERLDGIVGIYQPWGDTPREIADSRLVPLPVQDGAHQVWEPAGEARPVERVVDVLRTSTAPGEPIFAYPAVPGFYFLADRPNATRFNHLFAGMASPADQEEMVRQLERVRYVVWDDADVYHWVKPEDNPILMAYLRDHFRESQVIWPYAILTRDGTGPPRPKP